MSNRRRIIIIMVSVISGTVLSFFIFKARKGPAGLTNDDYSTLITNFIFSLAIIVGVGLMFAWKKNKEEKSDRN
ncbi:MAG: hypothetical protein ABI772_00390 [Bacteroidota bacterium]